MSIFANNMLVGMHDNAAQVAANARKIKGRTWSRALDRSWGKFLVGNDSAIEQLQQQLTGIDTAVSQEVQSLPWLNHLGDIEVENSISETWIDMATTFRKASTARFLEQFIFTLDQQLMREAIKRSKEMLSWFLRDIESVSVLDCDRIDTIEFIRHRISQLGGDTAQVALLYFIEQKSIAQIVSETLLSRATVARRIAHAKARLPALLK